MILTHPVGFICLKKPDCPEETRDYRRSVHLVFSHVKVDVVARDQTSGYRGERLYRWSHHNSIATKRVFYIFFKDNN